MSADGTTRAVAQVGLAQASVLVNALGKSKLALSGAALTISGFFGIFGVVSLTPQRGLISVYVMLFGATLCAFAMGAQSEMLAKYCGFIFRPNGQLFFLLIAGNLAWTIGLLGFLAALFTNFVAVTSWYNTEGVDRPPVPEWLSGQSRNRNERGATGMVDMNDDELL